MKNFLFFIFCLSFTCQLKSQNTPDSILHAKRKVAYSEWDFQLGDYYHSLISKSYKDSVGLKRKWINNINLTPGITSVSDFDMSSPFGYLDMGIGIHPTAKWGIQLQSSSNSINIYDISGSQNNSKLSISYRVNEKWELKLNSHTVRISGNYYGLDSTEVIRDTINPTEPILISGDRITTTTGSVFKESRNLSIGLIQYGNRLKIGGYFSFRNQTLIDSLTTNVKDSMVQEVGGNGEWNQLPTSTSETSTSTSSQFRYAQLSFYGQWNPVIYNSGLRFTSWLEIPINEGKLGFSPFFQTELLLTPNTWIGGWVRDYTNNLEPIENGSMIQNFGYGNVYLKYGGFVNYQKSKRWWIRFDIELQKRKAYKTSYEYSTLSLGFKFTYRLI